MSHKINYSRRPYHENQKKNTNYLTDDDMDDGSQFLICDLMKKLIENEKQHLHANDQAPISMDNAVDEYGLWQDYCNSQNEDVELDVDNADLSLIGPTTTEMNLDGLEYVAGFFLQRSTLI